MENGLRLPWWEFRRTDFALPGSVEPPDSRAEEGLLAGFLQAAGRAETADCFMSGGCGVATLKVVRKVTQAHGAVPGCRCRR